MRKLKTLNAAAPNFVHGCDAALLISAANALAEAGITNIATIHDCVAFRAPEVAKGRDIVLDQLAKLDINHDPLAELRDAVASIGPLPAKGSLDPNAVRKAIYAFS
jgi:DNA-directed RNA polymerase, mitochondrial